MEEFIRLAVIPDGHIVVAACQDECANQLSWECKKWFEAMGSQEISNLKYRESFSFIGVMGKSQPNEKKANGVND